MRAERARLLAQRYPEAAEPLLVIAAAFEVADGEKPTWDELPQLMERIREAIRPFAPEPIRDAKPVAPEVYQNEPDPYDPACFCTRVALEAWARHAPLQQGNPSPNECPKCGHAPQLGILRTEGHGHVLSLQCSLCRTEWAYRRGTCPECGETDSEKIVYFESESKPAVRTQACESCQNYIHLLLPEKDLQMIPEVDELSLLQIDAWAQGQDLVKVWPNLAGV